MTKYLIDDKERKIEIICNNEEDYKSMIQHLLNRGEEL